MSLSLLGNAKIRIKLSQSNYAFSLIGQGVENPHAFEHEMNHTPLEKHRNVPRNQLLRQQARAS